MCQRVFLIVIKNFEPHPDFAGTCPRVPSVDIVINPPKTHSDFFISKCIQALFVFLKRLLRIILLSQTTLAQAHTVTHAQMCTVYHSYLKIHLFDGKVRKINNTIQIYYFVFHSRKEVTKLCKLQQNLYFRWKLFWAWHDTLFSFFLCSITPSIDIFGNSVCLYAIVCINVII